MEIIEKEIIEKENNVKKFYIKHKAKFSFGLMLIISLLVAKLVTTFVLTSSVVIGSSMEATLSNGDKGISDAIFFKIGSLKRFDIVTIKRGDGLLVKRLIAFPGERLTYNNGVLKINDQVVEEAFISEYVAKKTGDIDKTLNSDEYFVMGDNRVGNNSFDSRSFGPIQYSQIKGRGLLIFAKCKVANEVEGCKGLKLVWPHFA